jgi:hypothetical protein
MSRHPIGDRAMTNAERQRKYRAATAARLAKLSRPARPAADGLVLKVEHARRFPEQTAPWLARQLGHAAIAFRDALSQAIKKGLH